MTRILLINPNTSLRATVAMCAIAAEELAEPPVGLTASRGPELIADPASLIRAGRAVAATEVPADTAAVIVSGFGDPGAGPLALRLPCPVVGIGAAAIRAAARDGLPFAVATTTPELDREITALVHDTLPETGHGLFLGNHFAAGDPLGLMATESGLDDALAGAVGQAVAAGAQRVIIGGGPLGAAAERLRARVAVPLINPVRCAAREVAALLALPERT
ncbi:hypothetical protein ATO6_14930 [Oceanicola sp. 22II-s10i]|uniref:aspartate/glutamate racemase family protein n=1 Tax=Oceanicola sp. 22II-s10i TaxID=1317116 RepID=UPI000B521A5C|nr:aspartate/glutamate racemase family protein [Oceanicola sp. 22II-s10i]OWU84310.1 hypothetical protein ATO6_14930 [Oceanicola sp. 22II-s10i]